MRLIDADACIDDIRNNNQQAWEALAYAPTIDAVQVVRCEDCRHQEHCHETIAHTKDHESFREHWSEPIEWCSRGKRRGGEDE